MTTTDQLNDEERSILAFLETYFEERGMNLALAMLRNQGTKVVDLRLVIDGYRHLYLSGRQ